MTKPKTRINEHNDVVKQLPAWDALGKSSIETGHALNQISKTFNDIFKTPNIPTVILSVEGGQAFIDEFKTTLSRLAKKYTELRKLHQGRTGDVTNEADYEAAVSYNIQYQNLFVELQEFSMTKMTQLDSWLKELEQKNKEGTS